MPNKSCQLCSEFRSHRAKTENVLKKLIVAVTVQSTFYNNGTTIRPGIAVNWKLFDFLSKFFYF